MPYAKCVLISLPAFVVSVVVGCNRQHTGFAGRNKLQQHVDSVPSSARHFACSDGLIRCNVHSIPVFSQF